MAKEKGIDTAWLMSVLQQFCSQLNVPVVAMDKEGNQVFDVVSAFPVALPNEPFFALELRKKEIKE
jgi:hypothetical protein